MKHGGLAEILRLKQAPAGFVRQDSGDITTTQAASFRKSAELITEKQASKRRAFRGGQFFKRICTGTIEDDVKLTQRRFDGSTDWVNNKDALRHLRRIGHPIVTMNPGLLGEAAG